MIRTKHSVPNSCPMCGKPIVERDIGKHRCLAPAGPESRTTREGEPVKRPDYSWIKVKRYVDDASLTWEERYARLMKHHEEETTFLINEVNKLRNK